MEQISPSDWSCIEVTLIFVERSSREYLYVYNMSSITSPIRHRYSSYMLYNTLPPLALIGYVCSCRSRVFYGRRLQGDFAIRVEQVIIAEC
jgi:hypothetical protein